MPRPATREEIREAARDPQADLKLLARGTRLLSAEQIAAWDRMILCARVALAVAEAETAGICPDCGSESWSDLISRPVVEVPGEPKSGGK